MSVLKQDHFAYDEYTVLDTIIMGNPRLYEIMKEKDALYAKEDFTDEDGIRASELEGEFAELDGWEAETECRSSCCKGSVLVSGYCSTTAMSSSMSAKEKVKILLAQALFGDPDDHTPGRADKPSGYTASIRLAGGFSAGLSAVLVIVVSHDRHFLNTVCTNIVDVDYGKITMYVGNYEFWYRVQPADAEDDQRSEQEERGQDQRAAKSFIQRFSANKSKSKQATASKKAAG